MGMTKQSQIISKVHVRQPDFSPLYAHVCPSDNLPKPKCLKIRAKEESVTWIEKHFSRDYLLLMQFYGCSLLVVAWFFTFGLFLSVCYFCIC